MNHRSLPAFKRPFLEGIKNKEKGKENILSSSAVIFLHNVEEKIAFSIMTVLLKHYFKEFLEISWET